MARTSLDTQVHEIRTRIIQLGTLVEMALEQAIQAVQSSNLALCGLVIESDQTIDEERSKVEQLAFQSLTLQQPLAGHDLRFLSSVPAIAGDLERMGDNAAGIGQLLLRMAPLRQDVVSQDVVIASDSAGSTRRRPPDRVVTEASIVSRLVELGQEAYLLLQGVLRAFKLSDAHAARTIWHEDDVVDVRYHLVRQDIMTMLTDIHAIAALQQDARIMQRMTYWLWIAHNLERIGDLLARKIYCPYLLLFAVFSSLMVQKHMLFSSSRVIFKHGFALFWYTGKKKRKESESEQTHEERRAYPQCTASPGDTTWRERGRPETSP